MNGLPSVDALPASRSIGGSSEAPGDQQVITRSTPGDHPVTAGERLSALVDAHYERLYRLARRLVPTIGDAQDLVQETFLKAAGSPASVPSGPTSEEAWLVRVLVNIRRDQWRKEAVRRRHEQQSRRFAAITDGHEA